MSPRPAARSARLVFVNRFFYPDLSATSQMLWDISTQLAAAGAAEIHVICSRQLYEDPRASLPANEVLDGIRVHRVRTAKFGRGRLWGRALDYVSFYLTALLMMLRLAGRGDILIVKTDPPLLSILGAGVGVIRGARLVNWLQDVFPEVATQLDPAMLPRWVTAVLQRARDWSMRRAATNIVLGSKMYDYFVARGIPEGRLRIIENWADGHSIHPVSVSDSALRQRLGLQGQFVMEYSGNLGRAHEYETLLEAAELLRNEADFVFVMIGGGANMRQLEQSVRERSLTSFRFLPYQPREMLADSLAAGDVHVACLLPALEGFIVPSKLYGILAAGRPTVFIGDLNGECARVLRDARCGIGIEVGNAACLALKLQALRGDPTRLAQMAHRARALFDEQYTLERATEKWLQLLQDLRQESGAASAVSLIGAHE